MPLTATIAHFSQFSDFGQGGGVNPCFTSAQTPPPPKSKAWLWILLGVLGGGLVVCAGCCGIGYIGMQGAFSQLDSDMLAKLNADPVAQQHLGTITSVKGDFWASTRESEKRGGQRVFIFHVQGTLGSGDVIGNLTNGASGEGIEEAKLLLPGGGEPIDLSF
ncbi:MAG: hypothetical protein SFU86_21915 [Pirellulaceae bacterium]|nr:hypothetical protein [Pirellulaceae bacterium]